MSAEVGEHERVLLEATAFAGLRPDQVGFVRAYLHRPNAEWASCCGSMCDPCVQRIVIAVERAREVLQICPVTE